MWKSGAVLASCVAGGRCQIRNPELHSQCPSGLPYANGSDRHSGTSTWILIRELVHTCGCRLFYPMGRGIPNSVPRSCGGCKEVSEWNVLSFFATGVTPLRSGTPIRIPSLGWGVQAIGHTENHDYTLPPTIRWVGGKMEQNAVAEPGYLCRGSPRELGWVCEANLYGIQHKCPPYYWVYAILPNVWTAGEICQWSLCMVHQG